MRIGTARVGSGTSLANLLLLATLLCLALVAVNVWRYTSAAWQLRSVPAAPELTGSKGGLLVLFQVRDCDSYRAFIRGWGDHELPGEFTVTGIPLDADLSPSLDETLADLSANFRLHREARAKGIAMLAAFGHLQTPAVVILDASGIPKAFFPASVHHQVNERARDWVRIHRELLTARD
jgi:hypothetical protein